MRNDACGTILTAGLLLAALAAAGCGPQAILPPRPVSEVQWVRLHVSPSPVNLDETPGPDAIWAQVFFDQARQPEPVTVRGALEILLYDGRYSPTSQPATAPRHTWTFTGEQLDRRIIRWLGLWGYALPLQWGADKPTAGTATLLARYRADQGEWIQSAPVPIPLLAQ
jgi:hypothetical protein